MHLADLDELVSVACEDQRRHSPCARLQAGCQAATQRLHVCLLDRLLQREARCAAGQVGIPAEQMALLWQSSAHMKSDFEYDNVLFVLQTQNARTVQLGIHSCTISSTCRCDV